MFSRFFIITLLIFVSQLTNAQDFTLLKDHSGNSFNGIVSNNPGSIRTSDNLLYYMAATAGTTKRSIYSTDGTPDGTKNAFNHSNFSGKIIQLAIASDVVYVLDDESRLYAAIDNQIQFVESFTFDVYSIYPANSGVFAFEERPSGEHRVHYIDQKNNINENLGTFDIYDSIISSKWGELIILSDNSTTSSTERTIITDGTKVNTFLLADYLASNNIANFSSVKSAIAFDKYLVITAKTSSSSLESDYIINLDTKIVKNISVNGRLNQVEGLNGKIIIKSQYSIYSFNPESNQLSTLSNDANIYSRLLMGEEYAFYFDNEPDENSQYILKHTDGSPELNEPFFNISTVSPSVFRIQKIGQDFAIIKNDGNHYISILRTIDNSQDSITDLEYIGGDFILSKVKGRILFSKYTSTLGTELYRSDKIVDNDEDGFDSSEDCDEVDPLINPGAMEISGNDIDENCDGQISTNIHEELINNIFIYPNPAYTMFNIDGYNLNEMKATLLDMNGNSVKNLTPKSNEISSLSSGVYIIKLEDLKNNDLIFTRLIKL